MRDIPPEIRSTLDDHDLSEIEAHKVAVGGRTERDAIDLGVAWAKNVKKIDSDRELPASDRRVWTEHDFAGTLFLRDHLERALNQLSPAVREKIERWVAETDDRFRSFTVDDSGQRTAKVAEVDTSGRGWWWFRVPESGPIAEDLSRYVRQ
jgi:hypothetical protein